MTWTFQGEFYLLSLFNFDAIWAKLKELDYVTGVIQVWRFWRSRLAGYKYI